MRPHLSIILPLLLITLICVGGVEGGYLLFEYFVLRDSSISSENAENAVSAKDAEEHTAAQMKNDYRIILQRNLFGPPPHSDQKDVQVMPEAKEELSATTLDIVLVGSVTGKKGSERAIILDKKTSRQDLYEIGDSVQGALVKEIDRGKVIISYNGKDEILDMSEAANVRPPPPPIPIHTNPGPIPDQGGTPLPTDIQPPNIAGQQGQQQPMPQHPSNIYKDRRRTVQQNVARPLRQLKKK